MYRVTNPATGQVMEEFPTDSDARIEAAIDAAHEAYREWRWRPIAERADIVRRAGTLLSERREELGAIVTREMGKRLEDAVDELDIVEEIYHYYADQAEVLLADEPIETTGVGAFIQKAPIGVLIGIMPWNYPHYQVARFAAPNMVLGNTILLKHSRLCPRTAAAIEATLLEAGVPRGVYTNVYASSEQIASMLADDRIQGVSLTGSERAGRAVAAEAGRNLKRVALELGGSDPMLILDTSDLAATVDDAVDARTGNSGQACTSPKRMIVMAEYYDDFVEQLTRRFAALQPGDPTDPDTDIAPLCSVPAADHLLAQIEGAVAQGARVRTGGKRAPGAGALVEPTVITDVTSEMDVYREELFGPVAVVYRVETEEEAIDLANDTPYGLGAGVFTDDPERAERVARRIDAGMVFHDKSGGSWAEVPFGGTKRSGTGRELGVLGIEEFMNKKVIRRSERLASAGG